MKLTKDPRTVFIACGSNIDPRPNLASALARLEEVFECLSISPTYLTRPWGIAKQAPYLNLVIGARTKITPHVLLGRLQEIERALGRVRSSCSVRYGPRQIDLDILLYGNLVIKDSRLIVPHPGLTERDFMLIPLLDIAPDIRHPADDKPLAKRRHQLNFRQIVCRVLP